MEEMTLDTMNLLHPPPNPEPDEQVIRSAAVRLQNQSPRRHFIVAPDGFTWEDRRSSDHLGGVRD